MGFARRMLRRLELQILGMHDPQRPRIFGIGLSKTATTSLCDALDILGFRAIHYAPIAKIENGSASLEWPWWVEDFDAMADLPVAVLFRELAERFPTSTFILTDRDEESWLTSAEKHFRRERFDEARMQVRFEQGLLLNQFVYGANSFDESSFRSAFRRHNSEVRSYFRGHPRFYELDICGGHGWDEVCEIVNRPIPNTPFPRSNVRRSDAI